ncbi:MAG TPA: 30S ribosomal protein S20 [Candidatus Cloacimonadota bacterium]|nr:30S ribosomal protein S20 [Candidatus Cloacimonadota bacterium]HOQ79749.1 30S ribosomal protein S20 [Candidatus Cloacimonadota bacterium]HPK41019.1 30S ribosomal protein S20 [Candidatus Cloacimonadota bacterium]
MPNHKSPAKSLKQDAKRLARNNYVRSTIKTLSKKMHSNISLEEKTELLEKIYSQLDKAAKKGVIHPRTASRRKSRIALYFNKEAEANKAPQE